MAILPVLPNQGSQARSAALRDRYFDLKAGALDIDAGRGAAFAADLGVAPDRAYADWRAFPIIPCTLCGSQENLKRKEVKQLMRDWEKRFPGRVDNIFSSLTRVTPSHLLDRGLYDFAGLRADGTPVPDGDIAFDVDPALEEAVSSQPGAGIAGITVARRD